MALTCPKLSQQPLFYVCVSMYVCACVRSSPWRCRPHEREMLPGFSLMVQRTPLQKAPLLFLSFIQLPSVAFCLYFPLLVGKPYQQAEGGGWSWEETPQ